MAHEEDKFVGNDDFYCTDSEYHMLCEDKFVENDDFTAQRVNTTCLCDDKFVENEDFTARRIFFGSREGYGKENFLWQQKGYGTRKRIICNVEKGARGEMLVGKL